MSSPALTTTTAPLDKNMSEHQGWRTGSTQHHGTHPYLTTTTTATASQQQQQGHVRADHHQHHSLLVLLLVLVVLVVWWWWWLPALGFVMETFNSSNCHSKN